MWACHYGGARDSAPTSRCRLPCAAAPAAGRRRAVRGRAAGASYADLRIHRITTEIVQLRDGELETAVINREIGLAVRVIVDGTWGFASHAELDPAVAADTARRAVDVATTLAPLNAERIELAAEPVYRDVDLGVGLPHRPVRRAGGRQDRGARRVLRAAAGSRRCRPRVGRAARRQGADVLRRHVRLVDHPAAGAGAADAGGGHRRRRRQAPSRRCARWRRRPRGAGRPSPATRCGTGRASWPQLPSLLAEKAKAPSVRAGPTDLVIDPSNLWLTIHESIGHATEYDRAIGYEAAYAGTSFATPDKLGTMRTARR